jgi:hypothetical protein
MSTKLLHGSLAFTLTLAVGALGFLGRGPSTAGTPPGGTEGPYDADHWFTIQRSYPAGRMPKPGTLESAMARRGGPGIRPALALLSDRWVSIGPSPIHVNNTLPYAGRITAIATHPTVPTTIYIGGDGGGIWRTTDGGITWLSLTDTLPVPSIQSIAIDPVNPQLIYASTIQRAYPTRWLRSTDGGMSWSVSSITTPLALLIQYPNYQFF